MAIKINGNKIFSLETKNTQYVMGVDGENLLNHLHWGKKADIDSFFTEIHPDLNGFNSSLDYRPLEYTPFGGTMYHECSLKAEFSDKVRDTFLVYDNYKINGNTLDIFLKDKYYSLRVTLRYAVYEECDVIARSVIIENVGDDDIVLERAYSAEFILPSTRPYNMYNANGSWGGENQKTIQPVISGSLQFESRRGIMGHGNIPSFILAQNETEDFGEVYFATLEYSGNFKVNVSRDTYGFTRAAIGVNDFDFSYTLHSGESFTAPVVYCGYSVGLADMSNNMNDFALSYVFPENFREKELPVLYNSWEATEFDVNAEDQTKLAKIAADIGVELFVMDDGWFGKRNSDKSGLGDWVVNKDKFPFGLTELIKNVNDLGMDFGLWFEPEMVNPDSDLYRSHPEWIYYYDTRTPSLLRNQLVLNLTMPEVQEYVFESVHKILSENNIKYVKWDMNRPFSEIGTPNLENGKMLWFLHTKAIYDIVDKLKKAHPQVAFESCSSGGGRTDYGAFRHFDQVWPSDNTDAVDRIYIQNGYSLLNPTKYMRAWVTDTPKPVNKAPLDFRFNIAMQGSLGIGLNLLKCSEEDLATCKKNIEFYKKNRKTIQFGKHYRLMNMEQDFVNITQYVNDESSSVIFIATTGTKFLKRFFNIRLKGLCENSKYIVCCDGDEIMKKSGSYLMNAGINAYFCGEYSSFIYTVQKI